MPTGLRPRAATKSSTVTAKSADDSSPQPAPAVAQVRRERPAAPSSCPNSSSLGVFSMDAISPPATARGKPSKASAGSVSPRAIMTTATNPPAREASGVTTDRSPTTRPRRRQPRPAASQTPLAVAKATARHSAAPLGGPSRISASGSRTTTPTPIDHVSAVHTAAARTTLTMRKSCKAYPSAEPRPSTMVSTPPPQASSRPMTRAPPRAAPQPSGRQTLKSAKLRGPRP